MKTRTRLGFLLLAASVASALCMTGCSQQSELDQLAAEAKEAHAEIKQREVKKRECLSLEAVPEIDLERWPYKASLLIGNGGTEAVSSVEIEFSYGAPGRKFPYFSKALTAPVPGGIEPGESVPVEVTLTTDVQVVNEWTRMADKYPNGRWQIALREQPPVDAILKERNPVDAPKPVGVKRRNPFGEKMIDSGQDITKNPNFVPAKDYDPEEVRRVLNHNPFKNLDKK